MAKNVFGLDLGSTEIKIYDKKSDKIWSEKTVLAIEDKRTVIAIGKEADDMYGRVPDAIEVVYPMKEGAISRFDNLQFLLATLLKRSSSYTKGAEYVVAVPTDVTEVEKKAFFDLVIHSNAKAGEVNIVERAIADGVSLNLDVAKTKGLMLVNLGGETTEISVIAEGGIVLDRLIKVGGSHLDQGIINLIKRSQDFLISKKAAENLRKNFNVFTDDSGTLTMVAGRDLITGLPMQKNITVNVVRASVKESLAEVLEGIYTILDRTPPEVRKSIIKNGIILTGGVAETVGIDRYIGRTINLRTRCAPKPALSVVKGLKKIINSEELKTLAYSMIDEGYRWMR